MRDIIPAELDPPLDVDTFLAGLDSPNHSEESRRAWVRLFYRDLIAGARQSGPYWCGGAQNGQPKPHSACNCTARQPEPDGLREALGAAQQSLSNLETSLDHTTVDFAEVRTVLKIVRAALARHRPLIEAAARQPEPERLPPPNLLNALYAASTLNAPLTVPPPSSEPLDLGAVHQSLWAAGFTFVPGMAETFIREYVTRTCPCACCKDRQRGCVCRDYKVGERCDCAFCLATEPSAKP